MIELQQMEVILSDTLSLIMFKHGYHYGIEFCGVYNTLRSNVVSSKKCLKINMNGEGINVLKHNQRQCVRQFDMSSCPLS